MPIFRDGKLPEDIVDDHVSELEEGSATQTSSNTWVYVDSASGDDGNDGLTPATAMQTIPAVLALVPDSIEHKLAIRIKGTFDLSNNLVEGKFSTQRGGMILFDGGDDLTAVDDNGGANYTADISSTLSLGVAAGSWTANEHAGFWIEPLSGPATGELRVIRNHTTTTFVPTYPFSTDPGACTFRIVRPTTTISASSNLGGLSIHIAGPQGAPGLFSGFQRLYFSGDACSLRIFSNSKVSLSGVVLNSTYSDASFGSLHVEAYAPYSNVTLYDPQSFNIDTDKSIGLSCRAGTARYLNAQALDMSYFYHVNTEMLQSTIKVIDKARIEGSCLMQDCKQVVDGAAALTGSSTQTLQFSNPSGVALTLLDSDVYLGANVVLLNSTSHGIEAEHSEVKLDDEVSGSNNGGAGLYAHGDSHVKITGGAPTLTGAIGDISTDGTTEITTWATVNGGSAVDLVNKARIEKE